MDGEKEKTVNRRVNDRRREPWSVTGKARKKMSQKGKHSAKSSMQGGRGQILRGRNEAKL